MAKEPRKDRIARRIARMKEARSRPVSLLKQFLAAVILGALIVGTATVALMVAGVLAAKWSFLAAALSLGALLGLLAGSKLAPKDAGAAAGPLAAAWIVLEIMASSLAIVAEVLAAIVGGVAGAFS